MFLKLGADFVSGQCYCFLTMLVFLCIELSTNTEILSILTGIFSKLRFKTELLCFVKWTLFLGVCNLLHLCFSSQEALQRTYTLNISRRDGTRYEQLRLKFPGTQTVNEV